MGSPILCSSASVSDPLIEFQTLTSGFTAQVRSAEHTKEENIVNTSSISPNAIAVALCGLAISGYVAVAHESVWGFVILLALTPVGAFLVNRAKTNGTSET
ncbi:hypothetical protein HMPREF0294_1032 [Corynebacterium glucuronolyticum ATCC 51867]|nr:hypothetical protein HMPREF0294_1032 [Corynebacterium glucuronolyticum ATCC 51867]